jgi:tetratricopeptide (TPR) repeat protein
VSLESGPRPAGGAGTRPPAWRDPWAWASAASVLALVARTRGTPRGEAVAEDFDFLRRALLEPGLSLLDGGGSSAFWRPVSHQLYYEALGPLILGRPGAVAAIHAALLALGAVLLYRALRPAWPGPWAAAAASFPLLAESTRTLVCWPSHFVDLGAFLFLALALHEASRRRLWSALTALLAALLCKELALVGALLLPFMPGVTAPGRPRTRWLLGAGLVVSGWALAYAWVRGHAGLELPHAIERDPALIATPLLHRLGWAVWNSLRAVFSLGFERGHLGTALVTLAALAAAAATIVRVPAAHERWREARRWCAWGAAWGALSWMALASIFPLWAPNRSQLGSVGFGIGAVALAGAAHPALPLALAGARLALLAAAPGTPARISAVPEDRGAFMDYPRLSRLQRLMRAARARLRARHPGLPHGAIVGVYSLPLASEYAFGGAHAVQVWYRDTTLRWVDFEAFAADSALPVRAFLNYQPRHDPQIVVLDGDAVRAKLEGLGRLREGRWAESLAALDRADSLAGDPAAYVFRGDLAGRRAYCLAQLGRWDEAAAEARAALQAAREDVGARYVAALVHAVRRERREARAQLDTLLAQAPGLGEALELRRALDALPPERAP